MNELSIITETCPCPLCDAAAAQATRYRHGPYAVVRCGACGVWYLSPRLSEQAIRRRYEDGAYFAGGDSGYDDYAAQEKSLSATFRNLLDRMAGNGMTGGSLLEVGCGFGYFLDAARGHFDYRAGAEMSGEAATLARERADMIYIGGLDAVPDEARFDAIVALQVIEHVYHPRDFLAAAFDHLNPGGVILLTTPDMGSLWRRTMGNRWPSFKFPEHVVFYDIARLSGLLRGAGFADVRSLPHPHAFPVGVICRKLGIPAWPAVEETNVWLPSVAIAVAGRRSGAADTRAAA